MDVTEKQLAEALDGLGVDIHDGDFLAAGIIDRPAEVARVLFIRLRSAFRRPCCDHCNNGEGDPAGHDYTLDGPHDGPCGECASERARREHDAGSEFD